MQRFSDGLSSYQAEFVQEVVDDQGRMLTEGLPTLDSRTLLVLAAGNVNSGSFDEFATICPVAREAGAWIHVDGAFGLWAAASPATAALCEGAELADSWSVDAHKTLNAPYDSGVVLCKDRTALVSAMRFLSGLTFASTAALRASNAATSAASRSGNS